MTNTPARTAALQLAQVKACAERAELIRRHKALKDAAEKSKDTGEKVAMALRSLKLDYAIKDQDLVLSRIVAELADAEPVAFKIYDGLSREQMRATDDQMEFQS